MWYDKMMRVHEDMWFSMNAIELAWPGTREKWLGKILDMIRLEWDYATELQALEAKYKGN